jgi:ATP-dependent helicase/nuclease subunit A
MTAARQHARDSVPGAQRVAADPSVSAWVEANAGSGKTHVLIDRVTRLMLEGTPPGRILCLTFTRAAAAEMANRLYERLGDWAVAPDAELREKVGRLVGQPFSVDKLPPARRLFAKALDTPGGLKIQTIHAFCESLIGRFPLEAGVAPHFAVMDERTAADVLADARDRVLAHAHDGTHPELAAALDHVVSLVDEAEFAELMGELAAKRGRLRRLMAAHDGLAGLVRATRRALGLAEAETAETIIAAACDDAAFDGGGLRRACEALEAGSPKDRERAAVIRAWLAEGEGRSRAFMGPYGHLFLRADGEPRAASGLITKAARAADEAAAEILLAEQARIQAVMERLKAAAVAQSTTALLRLGQALLDAYEERKHAHARLDYDDLILTARNLLWAEGGASWVLYKLDGGIDHILIDEAQDTNPEQWEVVKALSEEFFAGAGARSEGPGPRTVFAVGDEKQSIYSFQGVDPEAFDRMRADFGERVTAAGETWRPVELVQSFRSAPAVLEAVDLVFARDGARDGLTASDARIVHFPSRKGQAGLVELWPTITPKEAPAVEPWDVPLDQIAPDSPPARLADRIAAQIERWRAEGEVLESRGRPMRPGDIMILVRRRGPFFDEMVRCLKARGVPVAGTDRMVLTEQLAVMDLMALGEFLLLPEDDLTLAVVLKGPLFGFDDDDLFDLAFGREDTLWAALKRRRGERALFKSACDELSALLAKADTMPPFAFFADLLGSGRGRERLLARLGRDAGDPIDEFLSLALDYGRGHAPSLQGFLHWLGAARTEVKRDLEQGRDEVRVMTVHGAKGLEADVVFLPDTCAVPDHRHDARLLWTTAGDEPVVLWPVRSRNDEAVCAAARARARRRREQEYRRLLYVAMTRARDRLCVCGFETSKGRQAGCWYDLVADAVRDRAEETPLGFGETGWRLRSRQEAAPRDEARGEEEAAPGEMPAWAFAAAPAEATPPRPLAPSRPTEEEPAAMSPLGPGAGGEGEAGLLRGRLVHRLLQLLPDLAPGTRAPACRRFLSRPVHRLDAEAGREIARETLAVLDDPAFSALFGPGSRAEVPLAGLVGDRVVLGQVDRLLVGDDGVQVIDYKTDRSAPGSADEVPVAYLKQMAAYRALLAGVYPGREVKCALLWTCGPRLMALEDRLLDRYAP